MINVDELVSAVTRQIENNTLKLPSIPSIMTKITAALNDDSKSTTDIAKIIQTDTAVTGRLIQIANSPALRGSKDITSVHDAISILGLGTVKDVVMCVSIRDKFRSSNPALSKQLKELSDKSVRVSVYSSVLLNSVNQPHLKKNTLLLIGMLYYIGCLPVVEYLNKNDIKLSLKELDEALYSLRPVIGSMILKAWDLPFDIIESVGSIGVKYEKGPVIYSDIITMVLRFFDNFDSHDNPLDSRIVEKLGLTYQEFEEIVAAGYDEISETLALLS